MVLHWLRCGRVGRRRTFFKKAHREIGGPFCLLATLQVMQFLSAMSGRMMVMEQDFSSNNFLASPKLKCSILKISKYIAVAAFV
jgi:hypothetical protein